MGIPDYQELMLPVLETLSDNKELHSSAIINHLASKYKLSDEEKNQTYANENNPKIIFK